MLSKEYGLSKIFRPDVANFDKVTDENCYTSGIVHQTKLKVDKVGIEAAAVTVMIECAEAAPNEEYTKVFNDFVIDKSFGYIITFVIQYYLAVL